MEYLYRMENSTDHLRCAGTVLNSDVLAIIQYGNKHKLGKHTIRQDSSAGSQVWDGHKILKQIINIHNLISDIL